MSKSGRTTLGLWLAFAAAVLALNAAPPAESQEPPPSLSAAVPGDSAETPTGPPSRGTAVVRWSQPASSINTNVYLSMQFLDQQADEATFIADDFRPARDWSVTNISVSGETYDQGCELTCADKLVWEIWADDGGKPAGHPGSSQTAFWRVALPPSDAQVIITMSDYPYQWVIEAVLDDPFLIPPGTWWLVFYPVMDSASCGCRFGRHVAGTSYGHPAQAISPAGGGPVPASWTSVQDPSAWGLSLQDFTFWIEGLFLYDLGGRVWYDADQDGIQDPQEPGIGGAQLDIYYDYTCSGPVKRSVTADSGGEYKLSVPMPARYCIQAYKPTGWSFSPQDEGSDDTLDSDAVPTSGKILSLVPTGKDLKQDVGIYAFGFSKPPNNRIFVPVVRR